MTTRQRPVLTVYTDGSYMEDKLVGGWAFVAHDRGNRLYFERGRIMAGDYLDLESHGMELFAIHKFIQWAGDWRNVILWSDDQPLIQALNGDVGIKKRKLRDLIEGLHVAAKRLNISITFSFQRRNRNVLSAYADHLASASAKGFEPDPFDMFKEDRRKPQIVTWDIAPSV